MSDRSRSGLPGFGQRPGAGGGGGGLIWAAGLLRWHGIQRRRELPQRRKARVRDLAAHELRQPRVAQASFGCDARPVPAPLLKSTSQHVVDVQVHSDSIAKLCDTGKQDFATSSVKTFAVERKPINQVLAEALDYFMDPYWTNSSLARASRIAEGTIRNYRDPEKRTVGKSGKPGSAKLTELEAMAAAMGLQAADLITDMSTAEREKLYRLRAAEHYQRTGALPPWAPKQPGTGTA